MAADEGKERWMNRRRRKINKAKEKKKGRTSNKKWDWRKKNRSGKQIKKRQNGGRWGKRKMNEQKKKENK